jgi:DNA repair exonuclease SbcCD ATPase subunit
MILLKQLTWSKMFSYGEDNQLSLWDEPVTQLLGLNGHGKSSVPLILEEVLFNKNSKGIKKGAILNRNLSSKGYSAELDFSINEDEYIVKISRTGATQKVVLLKNGKDASSHTATDTFKHIEDLLGIDSKTFSQIVYQNNNSSLQFLTATDTNRKKFLIDLLSLEHYTRVFERVKEVHKVVAEELVILQSTVNTLSDSINKLSKESLDLKPLQEEFELNLSGKERLTSLKANLENIVSINIKISTNEQYISLRDKINYADLIEQVEEKDTSELLQAIGGIKNRIKAIKDLSTKLSKLTSSECPTCLQNIDTEAINKVKEANKLEEDALTLELKGLEYQLNESESSNKKYKAHQRLVADFEKYSALIDSELPNLLLDKSELEKEINSISDYIDKQIKELKDIQLYNKTAIAHNAKISVITEQLESYGIKIQESKQKLMEVDVKSSLLEVLKKAFSTNGLLAYKIETSVKDLQELTNYYLTELSDGRFQLDFLINNDKLNVVIIDSGSEVEITALSAGELARVTTSTLLAIRKLMSSLSKSRINVLFLDETIDVLDTFGKEKLIEVLLKEEGLNTFLISHGYSHPLIKKLTAIKEDGISRLEDG